MLDFLCILHCCMAIGRLQVACVEARLVSLPKENAEAVQRLLYRARTGVPLGATAAPSREEARALFLACEKMGPLLAYAPEDPRMASRCCHEGSTSGLVRRHAPSQ